MDLAKAYLDKSISLLNSSFRFLRQALLLY